jgi:hypothetical protein
VVGHKSTLQARYLWTLFQERGTIVTHVDHMRMDELDGSKGNECGTCGSHDS